MAGIWSQREEVIVNLSTRSKVVVLLYPENLGDDIAPGTLNSILKQAKLKE